MPWDSQYVVANQVIIEGGNDGLFVYAGTPALGNLIVSAAAAAGTDPYGNAFPQGINVTKGTILGALIETAASGKRIVIDGTANTITMFDAGGNTAAQWDPVAQTFTIYPGSAASNFVRLSSTFAQPSVNLNPNTAKYHATTGDAQIAVSDVGGGGGRPLLSLASPSTPTGSASAVSMYGDSVDGTILNSIQLAANSIDLNAVGAGVTLEGGLTITGGVGEVLAKYKANHTGRASTTTPTADPDLQLSVAANAVYEIAFHISYQCSTSGVNIKWTFGTPTGAAGPSYSDTYINTGGTISVEDHSWGDTSSAQAPNSNNFTIFGRGTLQTSSAGTFSFNWAQNTSNATQLFVNQGSHLIARRIA